MHVLKLTRTRPDEPRLWRIVYVGEPDFASGVEGCGLPSITEFEF